MHCWLLKRRQELNPVANDLQNIQLTVRGDSILHACSTARFLEVRDLAAGLGGVQHLRMRALRFCSGCRAATNYDLFSVGYSGLLEALIDLVRSGCGWI